MDKCLSYLYREHMKGKSSYPLFCKSFAIRTDFQGHFLNCLWKNDDYQIPS